MGLIFEPFPKEEEDTFVLGIDVVWCLSRPFFLFLPTITTIEKEEHIYRRQKKEKILI
jgi:hypothetical protein